MKGAAEWMLHRGAGLLMLPALVSLLGHFAGGGAGGYEGFLAYINQTGVRLALQLALLGICAHAAIGLHAVVSDYLTERLLGSAAPGRAAGTLVWALLLAYLAWGTAVIWI